MNQLLALAAGLDTQSSLARLKTQGQDFMRAYAEFVFYRDFALSNPLTAEKWKGLNRVAITTQKMLNGVNSQFDAVNNITQMMFGNSVLSLLPEVSNLYLMGGNGALAYITQEMRKFNAGMARLVNEAMQNAETKPE